LARKATRALKTSLMKARPLGQAAGWFRSPAAPRLATISTRTAPAMPSRPLARRGPARTGVLAYLVAWVIIPGDGQQRSIAENIAGKEHDAWSG
jgi:hypothetical protein